MTMKIKSEQLNLEIFTYTLAVGSNVIYPVKARPGEVLLIRHMSIHNNSAANSGVANMQVRSRGRLWVFRTNAAINAGIVNTDTNTKYLKDGDEIGFDITPNAAGNEFIVTFQVIRFRDDEYDKPT